MEADDEEETYMKGRSPTPSGLRRSMSGAQLAQWSSRRHQLAGVVESKWFDSCIGLVIVINSIVLVMETDERASCEDPESLACAEKIFVYAVLNTAFLIIYSVELTLKLWIYRRSFWQSQWNLFDFAIVVLSWLSEVLGGVLPAISVARIFRAVRLAKVFRVLMVYKELYLIIFGFMSAMRAIMWASFLMFFLLTIWSIFAVETLNPIAKELDAEGYYTGHRECERCSRAWVTVMTSNLTFLQTIIAGDSWGIYAIPLIERSPACALIFMGIFATVILGFSNLILAVIVDCAADARQDDLDYQAQRAKLGEEAAKLRFIRLCADLDTDHSGSLTYQEFEASYDNSPELCSMLKVINIEKKDLPMLFKIMDDDDSGTLDYGEFAETVHKMKCSESWTTFTFLKMQLMDIKAGTEAGIAKLHEEIMSKLERISIAPNAVAGEQINSVTLERVTLERSVIDTRGLDELKLKLDTMAESFQTLLDQSKSLLPLTPKAARGTESWSADKSLLSLPTAGAPPKLILDPSIQAKANEDAYRFPVSNAGGFRIPNCTSCVIAQEALPRKPPAEAARR